MENERLVLIFRPGEWSLEQAYASKGDHPSPFTPEISTTDDDRLFSVMERDSL